MDLSIFEQNPKKWYRPIDFITEKDFNDFVHWSNGAIQDLPEELNAVILQIQSIRKVKKPFSSETEDQGTLFYVRAIYKKEDGYIGFKNAVMNLFEKKESIDLKRKELIQELENLKKKFNNLIDEQIYERN
jgi:hypothetical protein